MMGVRYIPRVWPIIPWSNTIKRALSCRAPNCYPVRRSNYTRCNFIVPWAEQPSLKLHSSSVHIIPRVGSQRNYASPPTIKKFVINYNVPRLAYIHIYAHTLTCIKAHTHTYIHTHIYIHKYIPMVIAWLCFCLLLEEASKTLAYMRLFLLILALAYIFKLPSGTID